MAIPFPDSMVPAARPLELLRNQWETSPIIGTLASPDPMPVAAYNAITAGKLSARLISAIELPTKTSPKKMVQRAPITPAMIPARTTEIIYPTKFPVPIRPICE